MTRKPVDSSQITSIGHDSASKTMEVEFHAPKGMAQGSVYSYQNIPVSTYEFIINADSVGNAFNELVKRNPNLYPFKKVSEPKKERES